MNRLLYTALFSRPWGAAAWQWYYKTLYPTQPPADFAAYLAALRKNLAEPRRLEALQKMLAASKSAAEQRLGRVQAPTLVLMGSKDPDFKHPAAEAQWVADSLRASFHLIEGAGHYPQAEMPDVTAAHILAFLAGRQAAGEAHHAA
jgi:pimeloyl-ACP methyl ester carboxylesterase